MWIRSVYIDGYGHFSHFQIANIPSGLTILYGPNEAGKSTLVELIVHVLFGRVPQARVGRTLAGGTLGGRLVLQESDGGELTIERLGRHLRVFQAGQELGLDDPALARRLNVDRDVFRAIYAFDLSDLASMDGLSPNGVRDHLFAGALVGAGQAVMVATRELEARTQNLWRPRAASVIGGLEAERRELLERIRQAEAEAKTYSRLQQEILDTDAHRRHREQLHTTLVTAAARWDALLAAYPHFQALQFASRQHDQLPPPTRATDELNAALSSLKEQHALHHTRLESATARLDEATQTYDAITPDLRFVEHAREIEQLATDAGAVTYDRLTLAREQSAELQARFMKLLRDVGITDGTMPRWAANDVAQIKRAANRAVVASEAQERLKLQRRAVERARENLDRTLAQRNAVQRDSVAEDITEAVNELMQRAESIRETHARRDALLPELDALNQELDETRLELPGSFAPDLAGRARLAQAVEAWRERHTSAQAARDLVAAQVEEARADLLQAQEALNRHASDALSEWDDALFVELEATVEGACLAHAQAETLTTRSNHSEQAIRQAFEALGAWWTPERVAAAKLDADSRARLAESARSLDAAAREHSQANLAAPDLPAPPALDPDAIRTRLHALNHAEASYREYSESQARASTAPTGSSRVRTGLFAIALGLVVLGGVTIYQGAPIPGVLVLLTGALLAIVARTALAGPGATLANAGGSTPDELRARRQRAEAAFREAGLDAEATPATISRLKAELEAQRDDALRQVERFEHARHAKQRLETAARRELEARQSWKQALDDAGLDPGLNPSECERTLNQLADLRQQQSQRARDQAERQNHLARWTDFCTRAQPLRSLVSGSIASPADARALISKLRTWAKLRENLDNASARLRSLVELEVTKQREFDEVLADREQLRSQARELGVPESIAPELSVEWLKRAERLLERRRLLERHEREHRQCERTLEQWTGDLNRVLETLSLPPAGNALALARRRCEEAATTRREWQELDSEVKLARRQFEQEERTLEEAAHDAARHTDAEWQAIIEEHPLLRDVEPTDFEGFYDALRRAGEAHDEFDAARRRLAGTERTLAALFTRALELAEGLAVQPPESEQVLHSWIAAVERRCAAEVQLLEAQTQAREALEAIRETLQREHEALEEVKARLQALFADAGVADASAFADALQAEARRRACLAEIDGARRAMHSALGRWSDDQDTLRELETGDVVRWEQQAQECKQQADACRAEVHQASEQRGTLFAQRTHLADSATIAEAQLDIARIDADLAEARSAYLEAWLAGSLLNDAMASFRERNQPNVLRIAAEDLEFATAGRYTSLTTSPDHRHLHIGDSSGGIRTESELSRGTTELLYIILRLALSADYAQRNLRMPMVIDDILVNLDPERARSVGVLLARVARRQQIILLTCRPETRDLLLAHVPDAHVVELERYAGRGKPAAGRVQVPVELAAAHAPAGGLSAQAQAALQVIEDSSEPLGKADIIERSGIDENEWTRVINELRSAGCVEKHGKKRGATYTPTGRVAPAAPAAQA